MKLDLLVQLCTTDVYHLLQCCLHKFLECCERDTILSPDFVRPETGGIAFLWLREADGLHLHFECPKTRLGFTPSYEVTINRQTTRVEEDQGYMMRDIRFMLRDPSKGVDSDVDNQRIAVTEAVGI